ncbi:MAG: NAD(P)-binding domain-containing protein [Actinobacteria bacterium]|nr:NAD(P)-binding domain-containing protein [Actinomycetota bacterium]
MKPFPPGEYPVLVVGSGPGGLQASYCLRRLGVDHAVLSADDGPGGMFQRFPLFERLISWTHAGADAERGTREYELHDQNSLVADDPALGALVPGQLADGHRRPSRDEMVAAMRSFAERAPIPVRYECRWESTKQEDSAYVLATSDGEYRCRAAVFAIGMTQPWIPPIPGLELEQHYVNVDCAPDRYRGRRVVIVGKRNSAFEIGEAISRQGLRELTLVSPRSPDLGRLARSPLRPWYLTTYDEHVRGAPGRFVLNASVDRVEHREGGFVVHALDPTRSEPLLLEADDVIAATGFSTPLQDLPELGVATVREGRLPALSAFWESVTVPGLFFAGNVSDAAPGLRKHGVASLSTMVGGFRYNARVLARHLAETLFGMSSERPRIERDCISAFLLHELNHSPELAFQKGYLARVLRASDDEGAILDEGILPLEVFVDGSADGVAITLEFDAEETIRPVVYVRHDGVLHEELLAPHPLRRYDGQPYLEDVEKLLRPLLR